MKRLPRPALAGLLLLASCGGDEGPAVPPSKPAPAPAPAKPSRAAALLRGTGGYETGETEGGTLEIAAAYVGGEVPAPAEVPVTGGPGCAAKVLIETLLVDPASRGLRNVVVRLEGITSGKRPPERFTLDIRNCAFVPHVAAVMKGTRLEARSADGVSHTVHARLHDETIFQIPLSPGEPPPPSRPFPQAGNVEIGCDQHSFMRAHVVVHTSPYAEVTDPGGKARMTGIPPGRHAYTAWHEQLGEKHGEIEIAAGAVARLRIEYEAQE